MPNTLRKKSYSISKSSVDFLERLRKERNARSVSQVLEELLCRARRQYKIRMLERETTEYYDSMTGEQRREEQQWGDFGIANFPGER
jgi:predicted CopG family antitoxin